MARKFQENRQPRRDASRKFSDMSMHRYITHRRLVNGVLGAVLTVTAASSVYQCADTESIALGFGKALPMAAHRCV